MWRILSDAHTILSCAGGCQEEVNGGRLSRVYALRAAPGAGTAVRSRPFWMLWGRCGRVCRRRQWTRAASCLAVLCACHGGGCRAVLGAGQAMARPHGVSCAGAGALRGLDDRSALCAWRACRMV